MEIPFSPPFKVVGPSRQQAPSSALSKPKSVLDLPPETVALVGACLAPTDFVSMVSACRQWRPLKDAPSVTRQVAARGRLCPPPLCDFSRSPMSPSADPWADILFEARLLRRLDQGPIEIGPKSHYTAVGRSPNMQHLQLLTPHGQMLIRHLDSYDRKSVFFSTHNIHHLLQFAEQGNALIGASSPHGPIELFDLTTHGRPPRTIAPCADYKYDSVIAPANGTSYIFACSDGHLRTFTHDLKGFFRLSCDFNLGRSAELLSTSDNGDTLLAFTTGDGEYGSYLYSFDADHCWRKVDNIQTSACCAEFTVSPLGRFLIARGCGGDAFCSIDAKAVAPRQAIFECESYGPGILSPDETKTAVRLGNEIGVLQWPNFKKIGSYASDCHHDLEWLKPYQEWLARSLRIFPSVDQNGTWSIDAKPLYSSWQTQLP